MILDKIVEDKKIRLKEHKRRMSAEEMKKAAIASKRKSISFYDALAKDGLSIIGEFKKASPSMGVIDNKLELTDRIDQYNASVDAISVLTEEDHFHGGISYLEKVRKISNLPIIRKDFVVDEYQIYEAKVAKADAVLLIAAILNDEDMKRFYNLAYSLGLDVLLEVHDEEEMNRALALDAKIIGVNNRNLKDFSITLETTKRLSGMLPEGKVFISESGITKDEDIEYLKDCRINGILVGRAFMESENPKELAKKWKQIFVK